MTSDAQIRCPSCHGIDIRHSLRRGMLDALLRAFGKRPYRCRRCERRFYVPVASAAETETADEGNHLSQ